MNCFFCHREGENGQGQEMTDGETRGVIEAAADLGIRKMKITGGEPLLRPDLSEIISHASKNFEEVSLTTNGLLLDEMAADLKRAGLDRINVSLHSLQADRFKTITGVGGLDTVLNGVTRAKEVGLDPVKLNFVVLDGINAGEVDDMISFAGREGATLQLIEYMPIGRGKDAGEYHAKLQQIESDLRRRALSSDFRALSSDFAHLNQRRRYTLECEGNEVRAEVVRPIDNHSFCSNCSRLRVTSDGKLKPCLLRNDNLVDVKSLMEEGAGRAEIRSAFRKAVSLREPYWK
jgi:cyclic pyranopterin phosphate synthase